MNINYKRFDNNLPALYKEDDGNAGFDLFARLEAPIVVQPGEVILIPLNVATEIPVNAVGLLFQRSSTYRKWKVKLTNNVGVIDSTYRGDSDEWCAEFKNEGTTLTTINPGDKLCQALFLNIADVILVEKSKLGNPDRGGFGTSGSNINDLDNIEELSEGHGRVK